METAGVFGFLATVFFVCSNSHSFGLASKLTCHCTDQLCDSDNFYCANGCEPGWFGPGCQIGNISRRKNSEQSSTYMAPSVPGGMKAAYAVDGVWPSVANSDTGCSHTDPYVTSIKPWWYVILSEEVQFVIRNVFIYNRIGEYADRLKQLALLVGNSTSGNPDLSTWSTCAYHSPQLDPVTTFNCSDAIANKVGVLLDYVPSMLTLCEVIVTGYQYTTCSDPNTTGPGCLLTTCSSKACTDATGTCDSYNACQFPVCPGDAHWPPECWIRMPSLSSSVITTIPTCDVITVNLTGIQRGNLDINNLTLEVTSAGDTKRYTAINFKGSYKEPITADIPAMAGQSYDLSFRLTACLNDQCKNGPASTAVTVQTKTRQLTHVVNGSCAYFFLNASEDGCETVRGIVVSCTGADHAREFNGSGTTVCGFAAAAKYECAATVTNSQNLTEVYKITVTAQPLLGGKDDLGAIVGGAVGGAAAMACIIALLVILTRMRLRGLEKPVNKTVAAGGTTYMSEVQEVEECSYENLSDMTLEQLGRHIAEEAAVLERFKEQARNLLNPTVVGAQPENKAKNRFRNILPYDKNMVTISRQSAGGRGYINASYIDGYAKAKCYIATQGPLSKTVDDFWDMVWQEGARVIVMLTDYIEHSKPKCANYFPKSPSIQCDISVFSHSTSKFDTFSLSKLEVKKGTVSRMVHHCHFLAWPDHAVPQHCAELLTFLKTAGSLCQNEGRDFGGPVIVHCSAGVGRTGAYIALDYLLQRYQAERRVNVDRCVQSLREQRMLMVQTKEQYLFLHQALLHAMRSADFIMDTDGLVAYSKASAGISDGEDPCSKEWKVLQQCCQMKRPGCFPGDGTEPANGSLELTSNSSIGRRTAESDAFAKLRYCKSFYSSNGFLPVPLPPLDSQSEFWQTVYESDASIIVMLQPLPKKQAAKHWPDEGSQMKAGAFVIDNLGNSAYSDSLLTTLNLQIRSAKANTQEARYVTMFIMETWSPEDDVPNDLLHFYKVLIKLRIHCKEHGGRPMVVQCSDGVGHCGLFVAAMNALCRLIETNLVQVFHSVELVRVDHPLFVKNKTQYFFVYDLVRCHGGSENVYANC